MKRLAYSDDSEMFTMGACFILALAIHDLVGWQLCSLTDWNGFSHAFVRTPRGTFLDIEGEHIDIDEFLDRWSAFDFEEVEPEEFLDWDCGINMTDAIERAKELAPDLVASYYYGPLFRN